MNNDQIRIKHIFDSIEKIEKLVAKGKKTFLEDSVIRDSVVLNLMIIGEATKSLSPKIKKETKEIPWAQIAGLRDVLIHQYFGIDYEIIWDVVFIRLPLIKGYLKRNLILDENNK
jgi:uncharacterized protein with HEPN domain